ncbi:hypothetical protein, partial [Treponema sp. R8-4-B8]
MYACPSHNRSVNASPPYGGSGFRSARSPEGSHASLHPHFFAPVKPLRGFPYRAQKNVSYRR